MRIIDAAGASNLPADLKLLLFAMAYLADSKTGRGLTGQAKLAKFISCSDRAVRLKLERLAAILDSPVQVVRRPRRRTDGRGRTSDEYQLVLTYRKPASGESAPPTGSALPHEDEPSTGTTLPDEARTTADDQPEAECGPTGSPVQDQPEAGFRGSSQGILLDDPRSTCASTTKPKPRTKRAAQRERSDEHRRAHQQLTEHYFSEFERLRNSKPIGWGAKEGKAVYELLDKLKFDVERARLIVTNGLQSWNKATIMSISADPSACVAGGGRGSPGTRAGELFQAQEQRVRLLEAQEREAQP